MSRTQSSMVQLGTIAPEFRLFNVSTGNTMTLKDVRGPQTRSGLLIMFVCVHCPYVKHLEEELARMGKDYYGEFGEGPIAMAAIQSNDVNQYPEDGPEHMREQAARLGWQFRIYWMRPRGLLTRTKRPALLTSFCSTHIRGWPTAGNSIQAARGARISAMTSQ